ncbi:D-alanyl-D-alanine carboxypeptidase [Sulfitobacter sp. SK012]|uniref:D-alanyl-D-alanine carboxypeptidase family protein n=1 Tax=Sulfitobacter sp. SK012 TaxID=1389005 RepID=UPI000E0CBB89|nr:D-alanyl-D-alanine carboxypeptidase family protein [Sulfitobacter sp. SK012]AXI44996.1 D-alanyl-D-alanine carboxypeptidase [Sulfitobacter sp. SK012]
MKARRVQPARFGLIILAALWILVLVPLSARAAPYAALVIDARTGEVLHSRNADTRLHPASLTKMMTLYIAFEAIERGEISLDTKVKISSHAASEPPSKLGLRSGQTISFRYLIRAASVKSANDAATAIGEALSGSEAKFARRMNRTAKALGMTRTTFKNAHGLTESGHMSSARDMTTLGRHVLYDYPQYYNLFSRTSTDAGVRKVNNTNRRLLAAYKGADGIKTGYTRAAGFNLVASAQRGDERVIATVFGGKSTAQRNARVAELLDMGFRRSPSRAPIRKTRVPNLASIADTPSQSTTAATASGKGKTIRLVGAVKTSKRPKVRPGNQVEVVVATAEQPNATSTILTADINAALIEAQAEAKRAPIAETTKTQAPQANVVLASASRRPAMRPKGLVVTGTKANASKAPPKQEVVTRLSTSGGRHWGVNIGNYGTRHEAESVLIKTALAEMATLDGSLRKVVQRPRGFEANFLGMTRETADLACRRLQARNVSCLMVGPG